VILASCSSWLASSSSIWLQQPMEAEGEVLSTSNNAGNLISCPTYPGLQGQQVEISQSLPQHTALVVKHFLGFFIGSS
jgi:hypothetical protein